MSRSMRDPKLAARRARAVQESDVEYIMRKRRRRLPFTKVVAKVMDLAGVRHK